MTVRPSCNVESARIGSRMTRRRQPTACAEPGCPVVTDRDRCGDHRRAGGQHQQSGSRRYPRAHQQLARDVIRAQPWCTYCGETKEQVEARGSILTADHVQARTKGGRIHRSNYVTACRECNASKGDR